MELSNGTWMRLLHPLVAGVAVIIALTAGVSGLSAQRIVDVHEEPRHRVVVDRGPVRLIDIQILPGDTTMEHTHETPVLYTYISLGNGIAGGRVTSNTSYALEPFTHRESNSGPSLFRVLALSHGGAASEDDDDRPQGFVAEPTLENEWFRSYRIELPSGAATDTIRHRNDAMIALVSAGRVEVTKANGFGAELTKEGDWTWRDSGTPYVIRNAGASAVSVVVNEPR
jgi:hypothetical protein